MTDIYLDNAATTPMLPAVREALQPYLDERYANPSSLHEPARSVREDVEDVRENLADLLNCQRRELVFTSGGTEANNLAVKGIARGKQRRGEGDHVVTTEVEHRAVLRPCEQLEREGFEVTRVPVDDRGVLRMNRFEDALRPGTVLVSVMRVNNEVGTRQPIREVARITQERGIPLHTDAVQAFGKCENVTVPALGVDAMTLSGHKIHGPKGIGALFLRQGLPVEPVQTGGDHEGGRRAGTENVPGLIGLGAAVDRLRETASERTERLRSMTDRFRDRLSDTLPEVQINTPETPSAPGILNASFPGVEGETMVILLDRDGLRASTGAACESDTVETSHVLRAMSLSTDRARAAVRFSMGALNQPDEIDQAIPLIENVYQKCRSM